MDWITANETSIALGYFSLAFMTYYFSSHYSWVKNLAQRLGDAPGEPEIQVYLERLFGFLLLGLIPFICFPTIFEQPLSFYGINIPSADGIWLWWLIPLALVIGINIFRPARGVNIDFYPQVRKKQWGRKRIFINSLSWVVYLAGYEFIFRGLLFFTCLSSFGLIPAIMINCALYSISHIPKGAGEAFGAFFMGIIFCVIAWATGSILIPLVMHLIIALGNDYKAVAINPQMHFILKNNRDSHESED
jgi:hypothetical protein